MSRSASNVGISVLPNSRRDAARQYPAVDNAGEHLYNAGDDVPAKIRSHMNNQEVLTMQDKDKRNVMYRDLRMNGDELERQVVRFSGYQMEPGGNYVQTWSVAYPRS